MNRLINTTEHAVMAKNFYAHSLFQPLYMVFILEHFYTNYSFVLICVSPISESLVTC